ncbi:MAG: hypothetical protein IJA30_06335 [Bacilli bacterium]|nr:hypothetical protein [Bacilli bacterium]
MNVIVSNEQQGKMANLDVDIIKSITGSYSANELVEMFKNFFYSKMVLDVTAIKDYNNILMYKALADGLDAEKIIFFIPEGSSLCTPNFLAKLVTLGIYNFTTNIDGVKYLLKQSNTYNDVAQIQQMGGGGVIQELQQPAPVEQAQPEQGGGFVSPAAHAVVQQGNMARTIKIGVRNVTDHAGATSLIYMFKKELVSVFGENNVVGIEINKNDFQFYNDKNMVSTNTNDVKSVIERYSGVSVILVDLNDYEDNTICDDVLYLLEPSTLKLNKLIRKNKHIFGKIKDKKIIFNQSLLTSKDVSELEYEAGIKSFFNLPPVNDRKKNEIITELLAKVGLLQISQGGNSGKIFGLFRR